jgi:oligopeptide transport system substrate-binding protein
LRPLRPRRGRGHPAFAVASVLLAIVAAVGPTATTPADGATRPDRVRILASPAETLDPAAQGDIASAAVSAQLFEGLTAIDATLQTRPALAASWEFRDGGRTIVFHLRPGLTFSDGSPLGADDVVRSWFRIIDPAHPSPLVSLMSDVDGAIAYSRGQSKDPGSVGLSSRGSDVVVRLNRAAADVPAIVASPTFAVVPPGIDASASALQPGDRFVGSGGYVVAADDETTTTLRANDHYWAGRPAIPTIELVHDIGGRSSVAAFEDGDVDVADVAAFDATWIAYDDVLGRQLRRSEGLSLRYYGFDTSRPPFDDVRVRRAVAEAVDWRRLIALSSAGTSTPATGMVPPGIPGRSATDFLPKHDPDAARSLLADAGYPGGRGFPSVVLLSGGPEDRAFAAEVQRELGITIDVEVQGEGFFDRLQADPPSMFSMGWVADYPGPNDFLGILLGSGASNNYGRWSSPEFDRAVADALAATDAASARSAYDRAEALVRDDAPTIPLTYDVQWSLARTGLLGAYANGLGIVRMAGLAWAP